MSEPKFEVPAELRNIAERTIEQAEKTFEMFFDAASKSMATFNHPGAEVSKRALLLAEQNMKAAFDAAHKIAQANDLQEALQIQSEFLKTQLANAGDLMKRIGEDVATVAKDVTDGKFKAAS